MPLQYIIAELGTPGSDATEWSVFGELAHKRYPGARAFGSIILFYIEGGARAPPDDIVRVDSTDPLQFCRSGDLCGHLAHRTSFLWHVAP